MGRLKKQNGKSSIKKPKKTTHLQRTYLPRASEDPNRRHKVAEKVIDHKNEELHVWYLIRFKDMTKPQWLPENNISGCKQLIREYWIRENAMKKIEIDTGNNYTSQNDYQSSTNSDYFKYDKSKPSYNSHVQSSITCIESCDQSSPYSHIESFSRSGSDVEPHNSATSSDDRILQKPQNKVAGNLTTNNSIRYGKNRRASLKVAAITENKDNLEPNNNIVTSKAPVTESSSSAKGKNKLDARTETFVAQPQQQSRVERVQLQSKDSPKSALNKSSSETTSSSMQSHSAENNELSRNLSINSNIIWTGNIIKGSLVLFVASVNITPFPGRCGNVATLEKIANEKVPELCIQHSIPLSYALNLIKDKESSKYSVFEIKQSQSIKSRHNVSYDILLILYSQVGMIWFEEYKTAWIIFPYCDRICNLLKLPDKKELKLFAVSISVPPRFDPLPLNFEPDPLILPNDDRFSVERIVKTKVFLRQTGYYSQLLQLLRTCEETIHFTCFGNEEFPDVQELLLAMKVLGAIYEESYSGNISFVFVHLLFLKQLLFMRNFMDFKRLLNCKFLIFGTDLKESPEPIRFKEHLPKGGMLTVTTYTFLQEEQVSSRIMSVIDYQLKTQNAPWDYLLYVNVTDNLADISQSQNNERALRAWHEAMAAIGTRKARYIKNEEIFMPNKIPEEPPPMVSSLYGTMLRIHTIYAAERRDFILIRHDEEEELVNEPIQGVWKMSLQEFEQIFGPKKQ
ncbi:12198_t:CDS:10 [Rhizophagus irregularis]|nr:12198_t:CDS:10 [Rhizophagus irregularis]